MSSRVATWAVILLAAALVVAGSAIATTPPEAYAGDGTCGEPCSEGSTTWYFAEGYTGDGFQEWLTLFNPQDEATHTKVMISDSVPYREPVPVSLMTDQSESRPAEAEYTDTFELDLPPFSRITLDINTLAGKDREVSLFLESQEPIVAERPIYFTYRGAWKGCTVTSGATSPSATWYFAEGCTRDGFETWLLLANPGDTDALISVAMIPDGGSYITAGTVLPPHSRQSIYVNQLVGEGHDVSISIRALKPICAERVMYFDYHGMWTGGHASSGLSQPRKTYLFAEGYTGAGFEEWLTLCSPGFGAGEDGTDVIINCLFQGGEEQSFQIHLDPNTRHTININQLVGPDRNVSMELSADEPFLAERPMYFNYKGVCRGGHVSKGVEAVGTHWYLAEGTARPGFYEYLCIMNPGEEEAAADIDIAVTHIGTITKEYIVPARSRLTIDIRAEFVSLTGLDTSFEITSDHPIVVERPLYYPTAHFEVANAMDHIWNLSVGIGQRIEGTEGEHAAADYLKSILEGYGYNVEIQEVPLPNGSFSRNVIAKQGAPPPRNGTPTAQSLTGDILLIGAHFDTKAGTGSPGANDNASGTAVVLELARCFAETRPPGSDWGPTLVFAFFGGEEYLVDGNTDFHHFGSRYYVANLPQQTREAYAGAIIVDMVGVGWQLYARTMGVGPMDLCNSLMAYAQSVGISLPYMKSGSYSDHEPFENAGIPAVWLEYKDDPWYHTSQDSYDKINPGYIENTGRLLEDYIRSIESLLGRPM